MTLTSHTAVPCRCGLLTCHAYHVEPLAAVIGVNLSKEQAEFIAAALNAFDDPTNAAKYHALLELFVDHRVKTRSQSSSSQNPRPPW